MKIILSLIACLVSFSAAAIEPAVPVLVTRVEEPLRMGEGDQTRVSTVVYVNGLIQQLTCPAYSRVGCKKPITDELSASKLKRLKAVVARLKRTAADLEFAAPQPVHCMAIPNRQMIITMTSRESKKIEVARAKSPCGPSLVLDSKDARDLVDLVNEIE